MINHATDTVKLVFLSVVPRGLRWRKGTCRGGARGPGDGGRDQARLLHRPAGRRLRGGPEPFALFDAWFEEAKAHEPNDPNAFALATVDAAGLPNVRIVLLKGLDPADHAERGFVFYTNFESAKGEELLASKKAALNFHWKSLRRQVRVRGLVSVVSEPEADAYFATRPRGSRHRRLGVAAVAVAGEPQGVGEGGGGDDGQVSRRYSAPALLVGLPRDARWKWNSGTTGRSGCMSALRSGAARSAQAWNKQRLYP